MIAARPTRLAVLLLTDLFICPCILAAAASQKKAVISHQFLHSEEHNEMACEWERDQESQDRCSPLAEHVYQSHKQLQAHWFTAADQKGLQHPLHFQMDHALRIEQASYW